MKPIVGSLVLTAILALFGCGSGSHSTKGSDPKTDQDKTFYALGLLVGANLTQFSLTPEEMEFVSKGVADAAARAKPQVDLHVYGPKVQELMKARAGASLAAEKQKAAAFREGAAKEEGAQKSPSGLVYRTLKPGTGANPTFADTVKVHYQGSLPDGTVFDSSIERGQPVEFPLNKVIPCWTEGVQKMKVGEKAKLICPSEIAYGDQGRPPQIPGGATLVFEVELLEIVKKQ
jgi:FKBP-type peptidyl-prolyl cis-trans isomerase FkpA